MIKLIDNEIKLDFKDVLIVPQRSDLDSRSKVDLERVFTFKYSPLKIKGIGIIAANMDSVGTFSMAKVLAKYKMFTALHKHYNIEKLIDFFNTNGNLWKYVFYTIGLKDLNKMLEVKRKISSCRDFPPLINIDVANGFNQTLIIYLKKVRKLFPESVIMIGNIIGQSMTEELLMNGADIIKVGLGSGSTCLTRVKTGIGYPQLSTINETSFPAHGLKGHICSDGGCTRIGDICKAFSAGADFVMLGGMLSGTNECEGTWLNSNLTTENIKDIPNCDKKSTYFEFYGMSSENAQKKYNGGLASYKASEGKCVKILYKGPVKNILQEICGGLRSCCTYVGANCIKNLPKCASFIRVNQQENIIYKNS